MSKKTEEEFTYRITEALGKDVGRGLARLDPADLKKIGANIGDVVEIKGKRTTVAKVMPAFKEERGKRVIQIDAIVRQNAGVGLDERVTIAKVPYSHAAKITLVPTSDFTAMGKDKDAKYVGRLLEGLPLVEGDRVRAVLFGARFNDFLVSGTHPAGAVVIGPTTLIKIEEGATEKVKSSGISYEDIGGLHKEIQKIREMIELPLKHPQIFERLGIDPPKGVLLHGPPGTGKTLIARAVANETEAYFITISGPEVIHKFYGESEARLRSIFEEAQRKAPSIIFIDEIDAIAPKRESVVGEVEKRVVAQLLALMDGLERRGQIIVIGATNLPNVLDPALRRPGRFDREISIGIPDVQGRLETLEIHTRGMPLTTDVDLKRLAEATHGFVGADLEALGREAAMLALRRIIPQIEFGADYVPYETLLQLTVTMSDFLEALKQIEPSAIREVFVEIPNVKWNDVGGLESIKKDLIEAVEWPIKYAPLFSYAKVKPPKGIILHGAPGMGKTLLAKALACESGVNFISVKGPALMSKYVGESEKGVREVFKKARQAAPCIIFLDEIDAIAPRRGADSGDSGVTERVISQLLTEMDGIEELKGVFVLAATNRIDLIDPALLRPGRFDFTRELMPPDEQARLEIFKVHLRNKPVAGDIALQPLAEKTTGRTGADIQQICEKAAMLAIHEFLERQGEQSRDFSLFVITNSHFRRALSEVVRT
ncbi:MAG: CDC48 family AAA ATPase [Acidobacteria bacterium]|nr:CDC48 family AAA ATPase [Acidobacteriota bacterium]MBI3654848.1 CDC48 family AAA ATPase [Acidobacteriota bacterium]